MKQPHRLFFAFATVALMLCCGIGRVLPQAPATFTDPTSGVRYSVERYVVANYPVALALAPDGRLFYTEKVTGNVRVVNADGSSQLAPVITFADVSGLQERGLLGIAFDPDYEQNGLIWLFYSAEGTARNYPENRVVRFRETDGTGGDAQIVWRVPITNGQLLHNGGNLRFDTGGNLYVSLGDYGDAANAQNLDVPQGKIHRFSVQEAVEGPALIPAEGNPFEGSSIWAYGLRNPFDFTLDPYSDYVYATENGPDCDDEVNLILPGFNYGWNADYGCVGVDGYVDVPLYMPPLLSFTPTQAPTGITVYVNPALPGWDGSLFFCTWNGAVLRRAMLNTARTEITQTQDLDLGDADCRMDVIAAPNGDMFFSTVDAIYRLRPQ